MRRLGGKEERNEMGREEEEEAVGGAVIVDKMLLFGVGGGGWGKNREEVEAGRVLMAGEQENSCWEFQTQLEERRKRKKQMERQEDQKCVYEGRTAKERGGVAVVEVQKLKINKILA